jgi:SPP1 gp7 family putative phage head morphogenesis protein
VAEPTPPPGQPVPPPADGRWPAWLVDTAIAAAGAAALSAAFAAAVGAPLALAAAFWAWAGSLRAPRPAVPDGGSAQVLDEVTPDVREWLVQQFDAEQRIEDHIAEPVEDVMAEGWLAGSESARAQLDAMEDGEDPGDPALTLTVDWEGWEPGNPEAARQVLSADGRDVLLQRLLDDSGVTISSVAAHRLDEIAAVLSEALEHGASVQETAQALRGVLDNATWAHTTAWTEMNRATSAAALAEYAADGLTASEWMTAFDQRVCPRCAANEDAGPVPLGERFPSGDRHPPGHPRCRCGLLPVLPDDVVTGDWDKAADGGDNLEHYWKRGRGRAKWVDSPHPWTSLYRHLRKHMSDARAKRVTSQWFIDVFGYASGARKGKNPVGKG